MSKQVLIVGLGQFGTALARSLAQGGVEVLAVDVRPERTQALAGTVSEVASFDAMDEAALRRAAPQRRDVCVTAIGEESREASIVVTAMLRQMGAPHVIARANDALHERILHLVGAHEVINPERVFGERFARHIIFKDILEEVPLGADLVITELEIPAKLVGRSLSELSLPGKYEVTVVGVRRSDDARRRVILPNPGEPLRQGDILIVVAPPGAVARLASKSSLP